MKGNIVKSIIFALLIAIVFGSIMIACLAIAKQADSDDGKISAEKLSIEYDGEIYAENSSAAIYLPEKGQARFTVKGVNDFTVDILPNVTKENDFYYTVDGRRYKFSDEPGFASSFGLSCDKNGFTLECKKSYELDTVLSELWGQPVELDESAANVKYPFKIVVTSFDGETVIIALGAVGYSVFLTPDNIVF